MLCLPRTVACALICLCASSPSQAVPFTFEFDIPRIYDPDSDDDILPISITVDNDGTSLVNQVFDNNQVLELSSPRLGRFTRAPADVTGADGTLILQSMFPGSFVLTDATGTPMLAISEGLWATRPAPANWFSPTFNVLGILSSYSGIFVQVRPNPEQVIVAAVPNYFGPLTGTVAERPVPAASVPEPGTLALLAAGIGVLYRRRLVAK